MKLDDRQVHKFLGWNTQGDLGPFTFYTDKRGQLIFFPKSPPGKPPTFLQTRQRQKFRDAAKFWNAFPAQLKENWEAATLRLSLQLTGYNLFVYHFITGDDHGIATIERQSGLQLLPQG